MFPPHIPTLRAIALDWHSGQTSPFYSFGSTGRLVCNHRIDRADYLREADTNLHPKVLATTDDPAREKERLTLLRAFFEIHARDHEPDDD